MITSVIDIERAIVRLPHSNNNQYSEVVLPPVTIQPSSVVYTSNDDNPYHIPIDEVYNITTTSLYIIIMFIIVYT